MHFLDYQDDRGREALDLTQMSCPATKSHHQMMKTPTFPFHAMMMTCLNVSSTTQQSAKSTQPFALIYQTIAEAKTIMPP